MDCRTTDAGWKGISQYSNVTGRNFNVFFFYDDVYRRSSKPFGYTLANALVFKKVREGLGLDKGRVILSGAAPLSNEVAEYFMSLDIPIMEVTAAAYSFFSFYFFLWFNAILQVYGMSESSGPHSINNVTKGFHLNCAGKTVPGCTTKIANPDKDGNGEVFSKLYNTVEKKKNVFTVVISSSDFDGRTACLHGLPQRPWQHFVDHRR